MRKSRGRTLRVRTATHCDGNGTCAIQTDRLLDLAPAQVPTPPEKPMLPNSFAAAAKQRSPLKVQALSHAPQRSLFNPSMPRQNSAPAFRNPAFTTPQASYYMDVDDSPAMTEASPAPPETPDMDRSDLMDSLDLSSPEPPRRTLFSEKRSGKGALSRVTALDFQKDRVRKRMRNDRDRDIGSTRSRLPGGCDEDDSDFDEYNQDEGRRRRSSTKNMGWLHYILSTVSANPDAPIVFSYYLQLFVDACLAGLLLWGVWGAFTTARGEVMYAAEKARAEKLAEIDLCSRNYLANKCAPLSSRLPALGPACDEWETCMNQDPNSVAGVKASAGQMAEVINAFTAQLSWKSIVSNLGWLQLTIPLLSANIRAGLPPPGSSDCLSRQQHGLREIPPEREALQSSPRRTNAVAPSHEFSHVTRENKPSLHLCSHRPHAEAYTTSLHAGRHGYGCLARSETPSAAKDAVEEKPK